MLTRILHGQTSDMADQASPGPATPQSTAIHPAAQAGRGKLVALAPLVPQRRNASSSAASSPRPLPRVALDRLAALREPDRGTRVVYAGGGPRTTTQVAAEIEFLDTHIADFNAIQAAGGRYNIQSIVIERKDEAFLGRGNAWGPDQGGGTANTGAETVGMDYTGRLASFISDRREALEHACRDSPVAASLLRSAFSGQDAPGDGNPTVVRSVLARQHQGLEELTNFCALKQMAERRFPFFHLTVLPHTSAEAIDLAQPARPKVTLVESAGKNTLGLLEADVVRLNTGTTLASPVSDPAVLAHSFIRSMDPAALHEFLESRGLTDGAGQLRQGVRLALGGASLSAYDQLIALQGAMNLLERDDHSVAGYRVTDSAKQKYAGAITFISNTEGKWVAPRHVPGDPAWTQRQDALGDSSELHAGFLHRNGEKVFTDWHDVMRGSIALALGMTPEQVDEKGLSTAGLVAAQHERNLFHAGKLDESVSLAGEAKKRKIEESMQTLDGAKSQAFVQARLGLGMERHPEEATALMEGKAPLTFSGRVGYPMVRARVAALTRMEGSTPPDNRGPLDTYNDWMTHIAASPVRVHEMAAMLFEAGIASHMPGSYSQLAPNRRTGEKALGFTRADGSLAQFDAFIVSPIFQRGAEPVIASLAGQVLPVHPAIPDLGEVTTNRRILAGNGQPSHVEDYSFNGRGECVPGTRSRVGAFATDVNNRQSATEVAPGLAFRRMAAEHLAAVGVVDAVDEVEKLYAKHLPDPDRFDAEVRSFEPHYQSLATKAAFVRAAANAAQGDAARFAALAERVRSGSRVQAQGALLEPVLRPIMAHWQGTPVDDRMGTEAQRFVGPSAEFGAAMAQREPFKPVSRDDFLRRFVDVPRHVHEAVYKEAFGQALSIATAATAQASRPDGPRRPAGQGG